MAVTSTPIFTQAPNMGALNAILSTAMTNTKAFDGTETVGTSLVLVFTAGVNGSRVDDVTCRLTSKNGSAASGTTTASLVRFWINNGNTNTTATNNLLLGEVAIPATTVTALANTTMTTYSLTFPNGGLNLPANYRIYAGTTIATGGTNTAVQVSAFGGDY